MTFCVKSEIWVKMKWIGKRRYGEIVLGYITISVTVRGGADERERVGERDKWKFGQGVQG